MIAEVLLIVQLLDKLSLRSTPPTVGPVYDPDYDWRLKKPKPPPKVGYTGEGPRFRPPIVIPPISKDEATQWWLDATKDIPITSLPPGAR
jgi:hypothetical protein